ncbi:hypothetical protein [Pseudomonas putida]|uniref:Uncharacterized protein n=1 Tax=Pseudomonas putida TaxID=303 RepID=A0A8I1ED05_PSEPU|nr:hypothetical protein [Pseudomonas putida]MBI6883271.1 hypothetical protein [Pseudomonas putida]
MVKKQDFQLPTQHAKSKKPAKAGFSMDHQTSSGDLLDENIVLTDPSTIPHPGEPF